MWPDEDLEVETSPFAGLPCYSEPRDEWPMDVQRRGWIECAWNLLIDHPPALVGVELAVVIFAATLWFLAQLFGLFGWICGGFCGGLIFLLVFTGQFLWRR